jgi:hypothetical protein
VAISAAPIAGTNATITQGLALWIEAGGIGYGSSAALSGLNRIAQNATYLVGRSSTSTDINLLTWGVGSTDQLCTRRGRRGEHPHVRNDEPEHATRCRPGVGLLDDAARLRTTTTSSISPR